MVVSPVNSVIDCTTRQGVSYYFEAPYDPGCWGTYRPGTPVTMLGCEMVVSEVTMIGQAASGAVMVGVTAIERTKFDPDTVAGAGCAYCGSIVPGDRCDSCGAPRSE